jgi:ribosome biogenesis protein Nip4
MTRAIQGFLKLFRSPLKLDGELIAERENRYFLLSKELKCYVSKDFFYAGIYLGKVRGASFFPSFHLLWMMAQDEANKISVDEKTEWLFICGRDVFKRGIVKVTGSGKKGNYTLILNDRGKCLGFGRIIQDLNKTSEVAVRNISDIGDFLRREAHFEK